MLIPFRCRYYYRFLSQKSCLVSFSTKNNAKMLHSVSISSTNSTSRTGLRLLSGSASAENLTDGNKKDPRYDEDFIDIENTKPYVKNPNIQVTERCENIFKDILQLNSLDIILLLQLLKERTGMDPYSDPCGDGLSFAGGKGKGKGADASTVEGVAPVVEKTVFELKLAGFDEKSKIKIIKEIRAITGLGLKEAKELVEGAPKIVKKDIKKAEAEELKGKLEAVGAVVEIV